MIQRGYYRHYKGDLYKVVGSARHSETNEILVIYHRMTEPDNLWARPITMFFEVVEIPFIHKKVSRFEYCHD